VLANIAPVWFWVTSALILAPVLGSFVGLTLVRMPSPEKPTGRSIVFGRSECSNCHRRLEVIDLIPVFSFLFLGGKCRTCGGRIKRLYPLLEIGSVLLVASACLTRPPEAILASAFLAPALLALAWTDWHAFWLPDRITLPLIGLGLIFSTLLTSGWPIASLIGATAGYLSFVALNALYKLWRGVDGFGGGDAKLMAAAGAWLEWQALPALVLIASLLGLAGILIWRLRGAQITQQTALPFGVPLVMGFWCLWLYGPIA
jgi:leader peptidase (prepilin peptidase)/N-methyltransferase